MSPQNKKNTRRASMDAANYSWQCFRFCDDGRQWKQIAQERRAYFVQAANAADPDGTHVEIGIKKFMKAGGEDRTAYRRLHDLIEMGAMVRVLYIDEDGVLREQLTKFHGTKLRRLMFDSLDAAQRVLDSGQEFLGHAHLSEAEQLAIQRGLICKGGTDKWCEDLSKSPEEDLSNSGEDLSKSSEKTCHTQKEDLSSSGEDLSSSGEDLSRRVAGNRSITESTEERETERSSTAEASRTLPPAASLGKSTASDKANTKPAEAAITRLCKRSTDFGTPAPNRAQVAKALGQFPSELLDRALTRYITSLGGDKKRIRWAEREFFTREGYITWAAMIECEDWQDALACVASNPKGDVQAFCVQNPKPESMDEKDYARLMQQADEIHEDAVEKFTESQKPEVKARAKVSANENSCAVIAEKMIRKIVAWGDQHKPYAVGHATGSEIVWSRELFKNAVQGASEIHTVIWGDVSAILDRRLAECDAIEDGSVKAKTLETFGPTLAATLVPDLQALWAKSNGLKPEEN